MKETDRSRDIQQLQGRLDAWRRSRGGRGRRIPEELWSAAVELGRGGDLRALARALRVSPEQLARRARAEGGLMAGGRPGFVEISMARPAPTKPAAAVTVQGSGGAILRIEVPAGSTLALEPVIQAFLAGLGR